MRIDSEAVPLATLLGLLAVVIGWVLKPWAAIPFVLFLLFTLWFFRDPGRETPGDPDALIAPADGRIIRAGPDGISIFMNVFNVHVCRAPRAGRILAVEHSPGRFLAAYRDDAPNHNERTTIVVADGEREQRFTLIAGLIARRIVCRVAPGDRLQTGQRIGLIRFGSRVDVELGGDCRVAVEVGDRVVAGETILARVPVAGETQGSDSNLPG